MWRRLGIPKQISALNLSNLIDSFSKNNLPLEVWDSVASQKWKPHLFNSDGFNTKKPNSSLEKELQSYWISKSVRSGA
jgi:hypothetical protein